MQQLKTREKKTCSLVNLWILKNYFFLQNDFYSLLKNWNIDQATLGVTTFIQKKLSKEYLELVKVIGLTDLTKKTLLFVFQQVLLLLTPAIPQLSSQLYRSLVATENDSEIVFLSSSFFEQQENKLIHKKLWQVDCLLALWFFISKKIKFLPPKKTVFYFVLETNLKSDKLVINLRFFLQKLIKTNFSFLILNLEKLQKKVLFSSLSSEALISFGTIWWSEEVFPAVNKKKLLEKLSFYESEIRRCVFLLNNQSFVSKAPANLVEREREKKKQFEELKNSLLLQLEK